jgi:hypothetical protein
MDVRQGGSLWRGLPAYTAIATCLALPIAGFERAIAQSNDDILQTRVYSLNDTGDYGAALSLARILVGRDPRDARMAAVAAADSILVGHRESALPFLRTALSLLHIEAAPERDDLLRRAEAQLIRGNRRSAYKNVRGALTLTGSTPVNWTVYPEGMLRTLDDALGLASDGNDAKAVKLVEGVLPAARFGSPYYIMGLLQFRPTQRSSAERNWAFSVIRSEVEPVMPNNAYYATEYSALRLLFASIQRATERATVQPR